MTRRNMVGVAALALMGAIVVVPATLMFHRLHPDRVALDDDPGRHGIAYRSVSFTSLVDDEPLAGWYMPAPRRTGRAIVIAPGIDNNRLVSGIALRLAPALLAAGFDVLTFDLRGEGASGGDPITFGAREQWDVLGAVREAHARGDTRVGVIGFSLGAVAAILAAARSADISAVVADSPFADLTDTLTRELEATDHLPAPVAMYGLFLYRVMSGTDPSEVSPVRTIAGLAPRRLFLIEGTADQTVPISDSDRLLAAAPPGTQRWLVSGGRHAASYYADEVGYTRRVITFFAAAMP